MVCFLSAVTFAQTPQDSSVVKEDTTQAPKGPEHFVPIPDRWNDIKPPPYELNVERHWHDPYNQNKLKGDYPIFGQNTFFVFAATADNLAEGARLPIPSGVSAARPQSPEFFGKGEFFAYRGNLKLTFELYHGDVAFRPRDWEIKVNPVFNVNYTNLRENNAVTINPRKGTNRTDGHISFQELSLEKHLFDVSKRYDFISFKAGIQKFGSDFRGFVFADFNLGVRFFGSFNSNRYQYNLAYFRMLEKDTNSELNNIFKETDRDAFEQRDQEVFIANLYRQDFIRLGYTGQLSFHFLRDEASTHFDVNGVPVRPAVIGTIRPHEIKAYYLGWTGDGHFGRFNINHAFYQVFGEDEFNQFANRPVAINAQMAALELSVDVDWKRYRISAFYSSGDSEPLDDQAKGFDTIVDFPFFAGGPFSFWNVQRIRLQGVNLVNKLSLVPDLRSDKFEGQPNYVNPGLLLFNGAFDADLSPKLKATLNVNYLRFVNTKSLQHFLNQPAIGKNVGLDYGLGIIYRPFLNNNAIFTLSATALTPRDGFEDIFESSRTLFSFFTSLVFTY
jgi:hypothetical protein